MYDQLAEYYDWEHRDFRDDLQFYLSFAQLSGGPILEAACGTGRLLIPLALAGYSVVGVDNSPPMLELARFKVAQGGLADRVQLVQADMRTVDLGSQFRTAIVALSSFHHLATLEEQGKALERLGSHLSPGGLLLIDLINPNPGWVSAGNGALVLQTSAPYPGPDGPDVLMKMVSSTTYFDIQEDHSLLVYDRVGPNGSISRHTAEMRMRFLFRYEAELLLSGAGFRVRDVYGGYDLESYGTDSPRMIFVAEKL